MIETLDKINKNLPGIKMIIASYMNIQYCKNMLVGKMKQVQSLRMFAMQGGKMKATTPEGVRCHFR